MGSLLRGIPALVFVATALLLIVAGIVLPQVTSVNNGPSGGQVSPGFFVFGLALAFGGVALMWVGWGVWRAKPWRTHIAVVATLASIAFLAWVLPRSLKPTILLLNPGTGQLEPHYDGMFTPIVVALVVFALCLACLAVTEIRQRRLRTGAGVR